MLCSFDFFGISDTVERELNFLIEDALNNQASEAQVIVDHAEFGCSGCRVLVLLS